MTARPIRLVLFDVDGVLTDGSLIYGRDGEELKSFNARDGVGIALLHAHGVETGVLSAKRSEALQARIRDLRMSVSLIGVSDKLSALRPLLTELGLAPDEVAFVGDDVLDLAAGNHVGLFLAPADAHELVRDAAKVLAATGGTGVARAAAEYILVHNNGIERDHLYRRLLGENGERIVQ